MLGCSALVDYPACARQFWSGGAPSLTRACSVCWQRDGRECASTLLIVIVVFSPNQGAGDDQFAYFSPTRTLDFERWGERV